ncbi:MAG: hypothetical protein P1P78_12625 [Methyloprofundus sp.]|nr:hypothetical protein [Methyloprofundus sp.]
MHALFNPNLALKVDDKWVNIYDLLSLDKLANQHNNDGDLMLMSPQQKFWNIIKIYQGTD